ncbi:MAG: nucleoside hydrolase [Xanthomonadaceae bacterium]|nr:nucleoside hydrolase [Xanthomonadaceae bacterium]
MPHKLPILIDTDPGVDDALAILMAHRHADVVGLGIAAGNVGLAHTTANALKLVETIGATTPVFAGCAQPLVAPPPESAAFVHGRDGFGDTGYLPGARRADGEPAALAILRLAREHAGKLVIVALAPLTNLALALRLDPDLPSRVARLVVMGGAVTGRGNTSVAAEFNIGFDPEAASIVFAAWPQIELVDWELTTRHGIGFDTIARWCAADDPRARFFDAISRKTRAWSQARGRRQLMLADPLAMAVALQPELVTRTQEHHVDIALHGAARGATLVDWENRSGRAPNARIVADVEQAGFEALAASAFGTE